MYSTVGPAWRIPKYSIYKNLGPCVWNNQNQNETANLLMMMKNTCFKSSSFAVVNIHENKRKIKGGLWLIFSTFISSLFRSCHSNQAMQAITHKLWAHSFNNLKTSRKLRRMSLSQKQETALHPNSQPVWKHERQKPVKVKTSEFALSTDLFITCSKYSYLGGKLRSLSWSKIQPLFI